LKDNPDIVELYGAKAITGLGKLIQKWLNKYQQKNTKHFQSVEETEWFTTDSMSVFWGRLKTKIDKYMLKPMGKQYITKDEFLLFLNKLKGMQEIHDQY
jgi:hypothetical protein